MRESDYIRLKAIKKEIEQVLENHSRAIESLTKELASVKSYVSSMQTDIREVNKVNRSIIKAIKNSQERILKERSNKIKTDILMGNNKLKKSFKGHSSRGKK